jgi:hypothetical protein
MKWKEKTTDWDRTAGETDEPSSKLCRVEFEERGLCRTQYTNAASRVEIKYYIGEK